MDARYCCSATTIPMPRVCALISVLPPHLRRPFSKNIFFHLIPSHPTINQSITALVPQYHSNLTIPVLLLTLQGVNSPVVLSCMFVFFSCHYCLVIRTVARASVEFLGTTFFHLSAAPPTPLFLSHPHTFFRNPSHVQTYTYNIPQCQMKRIRSCTAVASRPCSGEHGSCITTTAPEYVQFVQCYFHFILRLLYPCRLSRPR